MLQGDKITITLLPIKRTPAIEGWRFSHPCRCMRRRNNNPLRQRPVFGVQLWEEAHGGGGQIQRCVFTCAQHSHFSGEESTTFHQIITFLKKYFWMNSKILNEFKNEFKLQAFVTQVLFATVICPDCKWGTKNMDMAKKNVFRALTNEKDIFNKKLKIPSELLMRNKIQFCWSIP